MDDESREAAARRAKGDGRAGEPTDRGRVTAIAIDLPSLRQHPDFAPVVEYLTVIQTMRDDGSSLLFVRGDDLDVMAEKDGRPVPEFLNRLDQLGVIVSRN